MGNIDGVSQAVSDPSQAPSGALAFSCDEKPVFGSFVVARRKQIYVGVTVEVLHTVGTIETVLQSQGAAP